MQELHHNDIITYALTHLAGQYAREKDDILRDLRNYRAAESSTGVRLGSQDASGTRAVSDASDRPLPPQKPTRYL